MKLKALAAIVVATMAFASTVHADDRVRLLGTTRLAERENDRDVIPVDCRPRVGAIKLRAAQGSAELERVWIRFGNGERDEIRVRDRLRQGSETRWIDLNGGRRCVVAVGVVGDSENWRGRDRDRDGYRDGRRGDRHGRGQTRIEVYGRFGR